MLLAELTMGASFTGDDGVKWVLTDQLADGDKIMFTLEKRKPAEPPDELLSEI